MSTYHTHIRDPNWNMSGSYMCDPNWNMNGSYIKTIEFNNHSKKKKKEFHFLSVYIEKWNC